MRLERADLRLKRAVLKPERADVRPERPDLKSEMPDLKPEWTGGRTNESPPVFYRTSSPSGPQPKSPNLLFSCNFFASICKGCLKTSLKR